MLEPVRNLGSGQPPAAEGEGEWAARNPSRLGKGEGARQCDRGGRDGSGKQRATPAAEGEVPLPLCTQPKLPPLPVRLRLPPLPVHGAWELHTYELRVWQGELGKREGVGVGRETVAMAHSACSPTCPAPDLEKRTVLSLCKSNYVINIYISLLIDKSMKISLIAVMSHVT